MKRYKLTFTLLSAVHIGIGKDYEPTNYVICADGGKDYLYAFDEMEFYANLPQDKKDEFLRIAGDRARLYDFIKRHASVAQKIAKYKVWVASEVAKYYAAHLGKPVQIESRGRKIYNEFAISRIYRLPNSHKPTLLGSSIKGSISTAFGAHLISAGNSIETVKERTQKPGDSNIFKNLLIADCQILAQGTKIDKVTNTKRDGSDGGGVFQYLEFILPSCRFESVVSVKCDELDIPKLAKYCNAHYAPIFDSLFTDIGTSKALRKGFNRITPKENQFILRLGQHSGRRAVTWSGTPESTIWLTEDGLPFGWVLCEFKQI